MDFADFDETALNAARRGDFALLTEKLRRGDKITTGEREFLADWLEKKIKLKSGPPERLQYLDQLVLDAYLIMTEVQGIKRLSVMQEIADAIGESRVNVGKRVKRAERLDHGMRRAAFMMTLHMEKLSDIFQPHTPLLFSLTREKIEAMKNVFIE